VARVCLPGRVVRGLGKLEQLRVEAHGCREKEGGTVLAGKGKGKVKLLPTLHFSGTGARKYHRKGELSVQEKKKERREKDQTLQRGHYSSRKGRSAERKGKIARRVFCPSFGMKVDHYTHAWHEGDNFGGRRASVSVNKKKK